MRVFRSNTELRRFLRNRMTRAALVVAACIPLLYGALYLWAFWNPTGNLDKVPAAIVNLDAGAKTSNGTQVDAGQQIADELTSDPKLAWKETSAADASQGLEAGTYYTVLTIPKDFSAAIATAGTSKPVQAPLQVTYNDANGYTARTILNSVLSQVRTAVSNSLGEKMVSQLLLGYGDIHAGVLKASDGSATLATNADKAADGAKQLADGSAQLADGADKLASGISDAATGAHSAATGAQQLASGAQTASSGAAKLKTGSAQVATGVEQLAAGMPAAVQGAQQLSTGAAQVAQGNQQLASQLPAAQLGAAKLATGSSQVAAGAEQLNAGVTQLTSGVTAAVSGVEQLSSASGQLSAGAQSLSGKLQQAQTGAASASKGSQQTAAGAAQTAQGAEALAAALQQAAAQNPQLAPLAAKAEALAGGAAQVSAGSAQVAQGNASLASGLEAAVTGSAQLASGATQVSSGASTLASKMSGAGAGAEQLTAGANQVAVGANQVAAGNKELSTKLGSAVTGAQQLSAGSTKVADGASTLASKLGAASTGATKLSGGANQVAAGNAELAANLPKLATGASDLSTGLGALASGLDTAKTGSATLATSTHKLNTGASDLSDGMGKLASGSHDLANGLATAVKDIPTYSDSEASANATVMASPVSLEANYTHQAAGNGEGFAPYFIGLSLWVGAMILWMLLRPISQRSLAAPVSATRVVLSNLLPGAFMGVLQVGLLLLVLKTALGLHTNHLLAVIGFGLLVSIAFIAFQQMINIWFGTSVGRLVVLVLLMLQLTSSGGTYPSATTPGFFQALHKVMPMTQVVNGFRESITGDLSSVFASAVTYLLGMLLVAVVGSAIGAARGRVWTMNRLHPAVSL